MDYSINSEAACSAASTMVSNSPLVSVIIPAYNAEAFISSTLESVTAQTYQNLEIIVVDDGSRDRTVDIINSFAREDHRIRLLQQPNSGVAAARNLAIEASKGEFIAPVDADDIWYPDNIAQQVDTMQRSGPSTGVVYSWSAEIDENNCLIGNPIRGFIFRASKISGRVYAVLVAHNFIGNASATMLRRSCLEHVGSYNTELKAQKAQGCEDWDLYLRIAEHYEFQVVPDFLIGYRKLSNSMSCNYDTMAKSHALVMDDVKRRYPNLPAYIFKLSSSNLYMYFADQSDRYQKHSQKHSVTRFWLRQALAIEPFITLCLPGFYRLFLRSFLGSLLQTLWATLNLSLKDSPKNINRQSVETLVASPFKPSQIKVNLALFVGGILYKFINTLVKLSSANLTPEFSYHKVEKSQC